MALNKVILQGRLVRDPELKTVNENTHVCSMRIAVPQDRVNKESGQRESDFFDVTAWRNTADFICQYFAKGDQILVAGRLQYRTWTDPEGNKRSTVGVRADDAYFCGPKTADKSTETHTYSGQAASTGDDEASDELPF